MKNILLIAALLGCASPFFAQAGSPDPAFGSGDGVVTTTLVADRYNSADAVAIQPDGKIVVVGSIHGGGITQTLIAITRYLPNGTPDNTFSGDGKLTIQTGNSSCFASSVKILPNGKILFAGAVYSSNSSAIALFRYNANGSPDNSFDGDGLVTTSVGNLSEGAEDLFVQPDGKILLAGYVQSPVTGRYDFAVLRYTANGGLDNSFGGGGIVTTPVGEDKADATSLLLQPDGKIVASGYCYENGLRAFAAVRYKADGTLDPDFSGNGIGIYHISDKNDSPYDSALQPDGKIILAGYAAYFPGNAAEEDFAAIRLTSSGNPDHFFGNNGVVRVSLSNYPERANAVVLQPDGKIILGGSAFVFSQFANEPLADFALLRLTANGQPDNSFDNDGIVILPVSPGNTDEISGLALQPDGKLVAVGIMRPQASEWNQFTVARFLTGLSVGTRDLDGSLDQLSIYPNPVETEATLQFELRNAETIRVGLYDLEGRLLRILLSDREMPAGSHSLPLAFDAALPAGAYVLRVETTHGSTAIKLLH